MTVVQPLALAERLLFCAERAGGKRALADKALMSESQLFRYISGDSEISGAKAVAIAKVASVDVGWLLTGLGTFEGPKAEDPRPPFRAELMEDILKVLTEVLVDFEWRLNPTQRAKYAAYAYMALRREEVLYNKIVTVTPERLTEGLWYLGKNTFDELLKLHMTVLHKQEMDGGELDPKANNSLLNTYAEAVRQGHFQLYNSTGGDAIQRWLGLQVSANTAERLLNITNLWRKHTINMKWLDVGCGNGRELEYIKRNNPDVDIYGIEMSRAGLAQCAKFEKAGIFPKGHVLEGEATVLPYPDNSMGMVYCRGVMFHLPYFGDPDVTYGMAQAMREISRVCAPKGLVCLVAPMGLQNCLVYQHHLTPTLLKQLAAHCGLKVVAEREFHLENALDGFRNQYELVLEKPD